MNDMVVSLEDISKTISEAKEAICNQCTIREKFDARMFMRMLTDIEYILSGLSHVTESTAVPMEETIDDALRLVGKCQSKSEDTVARAIKELGYTPYHNVIKRDCVGDERPLPFDFGILVDGKELLIEFDGEQHEEPITFYGGAEKFERVKRYDSIKTRYCADRRIPLLRLNRRSSIKNELRQFIESHTEEPNA